MNMRKKTNNYGHKKRYDNHRPGGGGHHQNNHRSGGPRKNWPALREKYLTQARDAMASGDRVLAENFLQHADHCWRMMMEEGYNRPRVPQPQDAAVSAESEVLVATNEENIPDTSGSQLPAFITTPFSQAQTTPVDPASVQNWEERDA